MRLPARRLGLEPASRPVLEEYSPTIILSAQRQLGLASTFETYLRAELETFSATTLASLFREIERKKTAGINMSEETYEFLLKEKGLPPLAEVERRMAAA